VSVVPLVRGKTVVESRNEFDAAGGRQGRTIMIQPLDDGQLLLDARDESNLTYDLRVGKEYKDHRYEGKADVGEEGIKLPPNSAVIIQTLEHVHVPKFRFGYIVPKVSLLQDGISNTSSKVDPGYDGKLLVTVFNLGSKTETLPRGKTFCTIAFHEVMDGYADDIRLYDKGEKTLPGATYTDLLRKFLYTIRRIIGPISILALVFALVRYPKFAEAIEHRAGAIGVIVIVISVIIVRVEAYLFHKIEEILERLSSK
jgi:dCTP deaminase